MSPAILSLPLLSSLSLFLFFSSFSPLLRGNDTHEFEVRHWWQSWFRRRGFLLLLRLWWHELTANTKRRRSVTKENLHEICTNDCLFVDALSVTWHLAQQQEHWKIREYFQILVSYFCKYFKTTRAD